MAEIPLSKYITILNEETDISSNIQVGSFYTYRYYFDQNTPHNVKMFYDYFPLTFIYDVKRDKNNRIYFLGFNFHHIPVRSRLIWYSRLRKVVGNKLEEDNARFTNFDYERLFYLFKKSVFSVRQYRIDRIRNLRRVPNSKIREILSHNVSTHVGVNEKTMESLYRLFIPPTNI